jgi:hypothetical protein
MRILVIALALISATFAGTTLYLVRELQLERERPRDTPTIVAQAAPIFPTQPSRPRSTMPQSAVQKASASSSANAESEEARVEKMNLEQSRRTLKMIEDPEQREGMLIDFKMGMRNSYPRLAQTIGLTGDEAERLFSLLAQQQVDAQERYARCTLDPACSVRDGGNFQNDPNAREIADLLGADRQAQFDNYKNTLMERESVSQLRTRLSDANHLPDDTSEALIAALADERQKIHQEAALRGVGMNGYGTGVGVVFSASDAPTAEAQFESAQENSRRMRDRAAQVLSGEQLRVFNEMQDELLISLKRQVRQKQELTAGSSFATAGIVN